MKVHLLLTILFAVIGCSKWFIIKIRKSNFTILQQKILTVSVLCDVSHLFITSSTTESPTTKDSLDSISIITKQELNDNSDLLKNTVGYKPYAFSKMMMQLIDFMEINQLSEPINRNSLDGNQQRVKYFYNKPKIPFDAEDRSQEEIDYEMQSPKNDRKPIKLETFDGYDYPKPLNPMTYPEKATTSTTESYNDFPGASARITSNLDDV